MATLELWTLLKSLGNSAAVVSQGVCAPILPGLVIDGVGSIGMPPSPQQLEAIISEARRAPYGKGPETVVDLNVRRVWQLEPSQCRFSNPDWQLTLDEIVRRVAEDLSLKGKIRASLYKLLVYEPGGFFLPHRDSEKEERMFATLVVCLPCRHEGGSLLVEHEGRRHTVEFSTHSEFRPQFAAFYADCLHEVRPVQNGHRLCLVYNLAFEGKRMPKAPQLAHAVGPVAQALGRLFQQGRIKAAIPLSHDYTPQGLSPDDLKGADKARFEVIAAAAPLAQLECRLGLLSLWQEGTAGEIYSYNYRGPRSYSLEDIHEEGVQVSHLFDSAGQRREPGPWKLDEDEILLCLPKEDLAWKRDVHEATGNEGVTIERSYRTAVALLWPRQGQARLMASQGQETALPYLQRLLDSGAPREECREWAQAILDLWQEPLTKSEDYRSWAKTMLQCLLGLGDWELACQFIQGRMRWDCDGQEGAALVELAQAMGWENLGPALLGFFDPPEQQAWTFRPIYLQVLQQLCCAPPTMNDERRSMARELGQLLLTHLKSGRLKAPWRVGYSGELEQLFPAFLAISAEELLQELVDFVIANHQKDNFYQVILPALEKLLPHRETLAYRRLWLACEAKLQLATSEPVVFPQDWAQPQPLPCGCGVCREVAAFLRDPVAKEYHYKAREDDRHHVKRSLEQRDVDFRVLSTRPSHTLVILKNQASYQKRHAQFELDSQLLSRLRSTELAPIRRPSP